MKGWMMVLALAPGALGLAQEPALSQPRAASPQAAMPGVEDHFQEARRAYLAGDRDGALRGLNEVLRIDPYHTGAATLFQTIRDEERRLRQVRLVAPATPVPPAAADSAARTGMQRLWTAVQSVESRLGRKLEKSEDRLDAGLGELREGLGAQGRAVEGLRGRQDQLAQSQERLLWAFGLGGLALAVLLLMVLVAVLRLGREFESMRWRDKDAGHTPRR